MEKHIFIFNPTSGNGKATRFIKNLESFVRKEDPNDEIIIEETKGKGHASTISHVYSHAFDDAIIYSVGGDGTLNEVIDGMNPNTKLSIIPAGSGNDFYRVFQDIKGTKSIDLGIVNGHKFINIASLGIDAKMADTANRIKSSHFRMLSYPRAIIEEIAKYEPFKFRINGELKECSIFTVCNGKYYGSGFPMNPNYDLNNGLLNMITAGKLTRREIVVLLLKILKETHLESSKVTSFQERSITVESDDLLLCNVDGEIIKGNRFEFGTILNGLTLTTDIPQYVKRAIKTIK